MLALVGAPAGVAALTIMAETFPAETRSAGIALTYSLTVTVFGATTQFVIAWLIGVTHEPMAPAYYVMAMAVLSIVAMRFVKPPTTS